MAGIPKPTSFPDSGVRTDDGRDARFTDLVKRHSQFVFRVACSVLRNASDAEEVVQDTFLKIYRADATDRMQDERAFLTRTAWRLTSSRCTGVSCEAPNGRYRCGQGWQAASRLFCGLPSVRPFALSAHYELRQAARLW